MARVNPSIPTCSLAAPDVAQDCATDLSEFDKYIQLIRTLPAVNRIQRVFSPLKLMSPFPWGTVVVVGD
jgi:hypothetical protein